MVAAVDSGGVGVIGADVDVVSVAVEVTVGCRSWVDFRRTMENTAEDIYSHLLRVEHSSLSC